MLPLKCDGLYHSLCSFSNHSLIIPYRLRLHVCRKLWVAVSVAAGIFCYFASTRLKLNVVCLKLTYFIHKSLRRREPANSRVSGSGQAAVWAEAKPKLKKCQSSKFWAAEMFTSRVLHSRHSLWIPKLRPKTKEKLNVTIKLCYVHFHTGALLNLPWPR